MDCKVLSEVEQEALDKELEALEKELDDEIASNKAKEREDAANELAANKLAQKNHMDLEN